MRSRRPELDFPRTRDGARTGSRDDFRLHDGAQEGRARRRPAFVPYRPPDYELDGSLPGAVKGAVP